MLRSDDGFTLMELLVAMLIITMVLVTLMMTQVSALVTTSQTRQRTLATAVTNQVMEELRALPYLVLSKGLHTSFQVAGPDPNVSGGRLRPPSSPAVDEPLVLTSTQVTDAVPLSGVGGTNVSRQSDPSIPGVEFVSRSYVSASPTTADGVLTLTVITTWTANSTTSTRTVMLRSEAYAPQGGCGDNANMPFLGACQAIFTASGGSQAIATTLTPAPFDPAAGTPAPVELLPGTPYSAGTLSGARAGAGLTSQQTASTNAAATLPSATFVQPDAAAAPLSTGGTQVVNEASNDVGATGAAPPNPADRSATGTAAPLAISGAGLSLQLSPGSGVSGVAKSSMVASCAAGLPAGQGCGGATTSGGAASGATLGVPGQSFGLVEVSGGGSSTAFAGRMASAAGASSVGCTAIDGPGCVASGNSRTLPTTVLGTGPWAGGQAPNGLVRLTGYTDSVRVERGKLQPVPAATRTRAGSLQYWNGTGYSTVTLGATTSGTYTGAATTWTSGGWTVEATPTVTITPAMSIASNVDPVKCTGEGCSIDADTGSVTVSVRWRVSGGATNVAFVSATTLGTSQASAAYRAAPDA